MESGVEWDRPQPSDSLVTFTRARDRPYGASGQPLNLSDFLKTLGYPQSVSGIIHVIRDQPNLLAPYMKLRKAATATGAETEDSYYARDTNNMFTADPLQCTVATSRGRAGNFLSVNLFGLAGFMRTYVLIAMKLTGVTWVDADILGRMDDAEANLAKINSLRDLLPNATKEGGRTITMHGFMETL